MTTEAEAWLSLATIHHPQLEGMIKTLFLEYECEFLGMSTVADWPPNKELKIFEEEKYPWSK